MKNLPKIFLVLFFMVLFVLARHYGLDKYMTVEYFKANRELLLSLTNKYFLPSLFLYIIVYLVNTLLQLPGTTLLTLLSGALFGKLGGFLLCLLSGTLNAVIVFWLSRYIFHDYFQKKYKKQLKNFNKEFKRQGGVYIFLMHITPLLPYQLINVIAGLTKVKTSIFTLASLLGIIPHALIYTQLGHMLWSINSLRDLLSPGLITIIIIVSTLPFVYLGINSLIAKKHST